MTCGKYIKCKICGKEMKQINNFHLNLHNITTEEYKKQYPMAGIVSKDYSKELSKKRSGENNAMFGRNHTINTINKLKNDERCFNYGERNGMYGVNRVGENNPMFGITHDENTRTQLSKKAIARFKISKHPMLGKHHTKESKILIGKSKVEKYKEDGNPNWRGGIGFLPYSVDFNDSFKSKVKERDNDKCLLCGEVGVLHIHHIDYDKKNTVKENCCSLCEKCHGKTHYNRKYWKQKLSNLLEEVYNYNTSIKQVNLNDIQNN